MSNDKIVRYATRLLCSHQGSLEYRQLHRHVCNSFDISDYGLCYILRECCRFAVVGGTEDRTSYTEISPDCRIIARTAVRLCKDYPKDRCADCEEGLHLCKYFVYGNCRFGKGRKPCRYSHELSSGHNYEVLRNYHLLDLDQDELFMLLLQNDPSLLPEVCVHYNKGSGPYGACTFKASCTKLHICQHFVQGDCMFGYKCKRSHRIELDDQKKLEERGITRENIHNLPSIYRNIYDLKNCSISSIEGEITDTSQGPSVSERESNEICLHYIRKQCSFQEKCIHVHFHLPYKWEVYDKSSWVELHHMEEIEKAFCDPENTHSEGSRPVDFLEMTRNSAPVRRLSTASSVTKPPHYILTTEWVWYCKGENGKWIEYGLPDEKRKVSSVTSKELEQAYLADNNAEIILTKGHRQYTLSFKDMYQRNPKHNTKRKVRRRPRFVSEKAVENKRMGKSDFALASSSTTKSFPENWDMDAVPETGYKLIQLSFSSEEFKEIQDLFLKKMTTATIHKIERIQNPSLWEVYQWQKEQMKKKNGGKDVDEQLLFHGTQKSLVDAICSQNFDWRICGVHGTAYGKGSYFARDASYSHSYTMCTSGHRIMFVARVLVGEATAGKTSYLRPPSKDGNDTTFYDSCVDNKYNPSIFIIFEKHQIYPEYVIEYSKYGRTRGMNV
ncbi:protein mono-ADP-ribosyltransferase PARP12-like isoform X1 [Acipenser ruthenus]|uniref:protein mono-ADP-ribosyltransferase PARP12-like isoform X1 n=1 Tax=Acipenser ruthenus TaxID=7906 RepID=UPI00145BD5FB|nr:protein mono-ADP-ribosyltransferase PARP12-like isoform X1 [Acipenser ruthenus]